MSGLATAIGAAAEFTNATWPFFTLPLFESFAAKAREVGKMELITHFTLVKEQDREAFNRWSNENYEHMIAEGHLIDNGDMRDFEPTAYVPYIYKVGDNGPEPEGGGEVYFPACKYNAERGPFRCCSS